jgi:hypothetical protein
MSPLLFAVFSLDEVFVEVESAASIVPTVVLEAGCCGG